MFGDREEAYVEMVTWVDITHQQGRPIDEPVELLRYCSVGVVIREDEEKIEICDCFPDAEIDVDDDGDVVIGPRSRYATSVLAIPKGCIVERVRMVRETRPKDKALRRKNANKGVVSEQHHQ